MSNRPTIRQKFSFRRETSTVGAFGLLVEHRIPDSIPQFALNFGGRWSEVTIQSSHGYTSETGGRLVWDGSTRNPEAHLTVSLTDSLHYKDTGDWTIAKTPLYSTSPAGRNTTTATNSGSDGRRVVETPLGRVQTGAHNDVFDAFFGEGSRGYSIEEEYDVAGEGVVSETGGILYLGAYDEWSRTTDDGQQIRLVVPDAAQLAPEPEAVVEALVAAANELDVGTEHDSMLAVAAPTRGVDWYHRGIGGDDGFWVRDDLRLDLSTFGGNPWIHEYIHTRQRFRSELTSATTWLTEAVASYYGAVLCFRQGLCSFERLLDHLTLRTSPGFSHGQLTDHSEFRDDDRNHLDYRKGRRVLAALDCKIQDDTAGRATFEDVFRQLNAYDGQITNNSFIGMVADITGNSEYYEWFSTYVGSANVPEVPRSKKYFINSVA
ncbi:hypothetical protein [Haloglomus litoreum]|uniref:hypothetical protein n=1 Tax=Haloglomus litoreum TaxID=3034026 RepID=UPI0023E75E5F|nr:hypothetical protein [Haloglomus sp. DT116]